MLNSVAHKGDAPISPEEVVQLRSGRFSARFASVFKHENRIYSLILAIDGNRRALESYSQLDRQGSKRCGLKFSDQRGVMLCSQGVRICPYEQLWDDPQLEDYAILRSGPEHFQFFIEGNFELVTNRNSPAQSTSSTIKDPNFVKHIRTFLDNAKKEKEGLVLDGLIRRIGREVSIHQENQYTTRNDDLKKKLPDRDQFQVQNVIPLGKRWLVAPLRGEEHFVGALYTMFAHLVPTDHPLASYWKRPLTFSATGIDSIAVGNESAPLDPKHLLSVEYKYDLSIDDEFNHPLSVTNMIVCWDYKANSIGDSIQDSYQYIGTVSRIVETNDKQEIGFEISDIRHKAGSRDLPHSILVVGLKRLLNATFDVKWRNGPKKKS